MNPKKQSKLFYVSLLLCSIFAFSCLMFLFDNNLQEVLFRFGDKLKGKTLNRRDFQIVELFFSSFCFFITFPFYFFNFQNYWEKETISLGKKNKMDTVVIGGGGQIIYKKLF